MAVKDVHRAVRDRRSSVLWVVVMVVVVGWAIV